jgi:hypothetical protein
MPDTRSPEQIERDIEREREQLSGNIHSLQDRFSLDGVARQVSDHLRDNGGEIARNVSATVKENPLGVALVGAGLAWLAFGGRSQNGQPPAPQSQPQAGRADPGAMAVPTAGARPVAEADGSAAYGDPIGYPRGGHVPRAGTLGAPAPAHYRDDDPAMDWLYDDLDEADDGPGLTERAGAWAGSARDRAAGAAAGAQEAAGSAAATTRDRAAGAAEGARAAAGSAAERARKAGQATADGARSAAGSVRDGAASAAGSAQEAAARTRARLAQGTEKLSEEARERVVQARLAALRARDRAAAATRDARAQSAEMYDRQPLVFGALAFAIGAAAAATLPRTRQEDEYLGAHSDRLIRRAQRVLEEETAKAQEVAEALRDEAQEIADETKKGIDESAPGDKSAVQAAADHAKDSARRVADRAKSEAEEKDLGKSLQKS